MVILLFLFWTLACALLTLNVFRPLAARRGSSFFAILLSFALGWLVGDLAPQWILLNFGILLLFSFSDVLTLPLGWGGLVIHVLGWSILLLRLWIFLDLPERLNQKMAEQLGHLWKSTPLFHSPPRKLRAIDWRSWWNPNRLTQDPRIEISREQVFYEEKGVRLTLDIYRPRNAKKKCPGLLQIHGGGWVIGTKRQATLIMTRMAVQGWVCFSVNYRFSPDVVFPEHLIDCKRALHWIRNHAEEYGVDPELIVAAGGSAGGHLAALTALTPNRPEFQPGFETADTAVQGCVSLYGVFDFKAPFESRTAYPAKAQLLRMVCGGTPETQVLRYQQISPANWVSEKPPPAADIPPFLLLQGETDALIPLEETQNFWDALCAKNTKNIRYSAFLRLPLAGHAFDIFPTLTAQCIIPIIERYLTLIADTQNKNNKKHDKDMK